MNIDTLVFNPFQENTYIVSDDSKEAIIIDAGCYTPREKRMLDEYIASKGLKVVMAVNTHGHVDHILGVCHLKEIYGVGFAMDSRDNFLVESAPQHGSMYGFEVAETPSVDQDLQGMSEITFGNTTLRIIHTPGHTPGHIALYEPQSKSLFTGDTLFYESIGRTDLPGGDYTWIMSSILEKIIPLGEDVSVYPGHGPSTTIGHEVLYNPFITEVVNQEVNYKG